MELVHINHTASLPSPKEIGLLLAEIVNTST